MIMKVYTNHILRLIESSSVSEIKSQSLKFPVLLDALKDFADDCVEIEERGGIDNKFRRIRNARMKSEIVLGYEVVSGRDSSWMKQYVV